MSYKFLTYKYPLENKKNKTPKTQKAVDSLDATAFFL